ncbi:MAG: phage holin family protein [Gammaproteobacteria bacterium]|nr:phage holin family protein [Gammaproteobacteria bacterium]
MRLLLLWILNAVALLAVTWLLPSIQVSGFGAALAAALVLGFINTLVRPVLAILTLPITVLTLGIFYLVLNGFLFWLASVLLSGFHVEGFGSAVFGAILYGVIAWALSALIPNQTGMDRT